MSGMCFRVEEVCTVFVHGREGFFSSLLFRAFVIYGERVWTY